ncbi:class I SAM-dependent methyltransferase [Methanococcoides sp. SA1]|nr:class I SAM-dependent methyltransferase [Methanococcoides sp. SA1]
MYSNEEKECYDSWHQDDLTHFGKKISLTVLDRYNFDTILDIGCGKGAFTHLLKKQNNKVVGIDLSETALLKAKTKYKDIDFIKCKIEDIDEIGSMWSLTVLYEVLSYIENWDTCLQNISKCTEYIYVSLYIPPNPIGYIKNFDELRFGIYKYFTIEEELVWNNETILILGKRKND